MAERPDKQRRREMRQQFESQQRAAAWAALPLPSEELRALFNYLVAEFPVQGCDHTLRLTESWLIGRGLAVEPVLTWLHENGGHCDCEAAANSRERWQDALQ